MPGLGRQSSPVPQPVFVINCRTGQFFETSGRDPHPGFPPGPPLAPVIGRLSGNRYGSLPNWKVLEMVAAYPLPAWISGQWYLVWTRLAPTSAHVSSGLYLSSSAVVG